MTTEELQATFDILIEVSDEYTFGRHFLSRGDVKYILGSTDVGPGIVHKTEHSIYFQYEDDMLSEITLHMEQHGNITYVSCGDESGRCYKGRPIPIWLTEDMAIKYVNKLKRESNDRTK